MPESPRQSPGSPSCLIVSMAYAATKALDLAGGERLGAVSGAAGVIRDRLSRRIPWLVTWLVVAVAACGLGMSAPQDIPAPSQAPKVLRWKEPSIDLRKGSVRLAEPKRLQRWRRRSSEDAALLTAQVRLAEPTFLLRGCGCRTAIPN